MHSNIDSFILYNAKSNQENTSDIGIAEPKEITVTEENKSSQIHEISDNKDDLDTLVKNEFIPPDSENYEHEILWDLEFYGSVNKLGTGAGVWIYNLENDRSKGHAYILNFKCTNNMA